MPPFAPTTSLVPDPDIGLIMIWQGSIVTVPENWALCDGNNGTPDLRNRFVVGSQLTYDLDVIGGNTQHDHDFVSNGHGHELGSAEDINVNASYDSLISEESLTGTTNSSNHQPTWYSLAFIQYKGVPDA